MRACCPLSFGWLSHKFPLLHYRVIGLILCFIFLSLSAVFSSFTTLHPHSQLGMLSFHSETKLLTPFLKTSSLKLGSTWSDRLSVELPPGWQCSSSWKVTALLTSFFPNMEPVSHKNSFLWVLRSTMSLRGWQLEQGRHTKRADSKKGRKNTDSSFKTALTFSVSICPAWPGDSY